MKRLVLVSLASGCYLGAHGSLDTSPNVGAMGKAAAQGTLDLGFVYSDDHQSGGALMGFGVSPLVAADGSLERQTMVSWGGRYERAFTRTAPAYRWFGRFLWGGSVC